MNEKVETVDTSKRFQDIGKEGGYNEKDTSNTNTVDGDSLNHSKSSKEEAFADAKANANGSAPAQGLYFDKKTADGRIVLTEDSGYESTAYCFKKSRKWGILTLVVMIQISMNFDGAIYSNAVEGMTEAFGISSAAARCGQMGLLVAYAFGCELWAPWSEEYGRWPVLHLSLFLVNCFSVLQACAPNIGAMVTGRILSGLSMAGGSVTIAVVADMWGPDNHQYGLAYVVWSSVSAAAIAPLVGGFIRVYAQPGPSWRWIFYVEIIKGVACQLACFFLPETRSTILLDREAQRRRKEAAKQGIELNIWGPNEVKEQRITLHEIVVTFTRPYMLLLREPIVLSCSLLSFSDMLIFIFLDSFADVFGQWGFTPWQTGLCFVSILVAYLLVWGSYLPFFRSAEKKRSRGVNVAPEERLYWLLWLAPLEAIGLFGFAWTSLGPDRGVHWFGPVFFAGVIGIANYAIYMSTVDYMVAAYGEYSASACGGNGFARDFLSGIAAMFATPFYKHFPRYTLEYPTTILACIAVVLIVPIFLLYFYGPTVRKNSKFAMTLANERESTNIRHQVREEKAKTSQHIEHSA